MNRPKCFYYITHRDNLKSILKKGILSHRLANKWSLKNWIIKKKVIYDKEIIAKRRDKKFKNRSLLDCANVYFQARNPMLYRVIKEHEKENIVVLQINSDILDIPGAGVADGNAASQNTSFFEDINKGLSVLDKELFEKGYWIGIEDGKRKIMAEALIPDQIPKEKIMGIYTAHQDTAHQIKKDIAGALNIMPNSNMFFLPDYEKDISDHISLRRGDMFLSEAQTFTISVNVVGVMGKGLASRAKYQFPDVYVLYQDLCRKKKLRMGLPYLYKREENYEKTLMEGESSAMTENGARWFLLFPTKNHWREKSPLEGIEKGLRWLAHNCKSQGVKSLALPALGCGLGGLDWKDVGPLMAKHLNQMDIKSFVYLPLEREIPPEQLEPQFLLPKTIKKGVIMKIIKNIEDYLSSKIISNPQLSDDQKAHKVIVFSSCFCAIIAVQPLPFADIFILSPIQMLMAFFLSKIRDKTDKKDKKAKDRIKNLVEEMGLVVLGGQAAQHSIITLYKIGIPFLGGFMTIPLVFTFTYAMGKAFDFYFRDLKQKTLDQSGEELKKNLKDSKEKLKKIFKDAKKEAKQIWQKIKKQRKPIYKEIKHIFKDNNLTYWEKLKKSAEILAKKIDV